MAVIELRPWSRRLHLRRLLPVIVAVALLLIVLSAFLFIPPAEAVGAEALATASSGHQLPDIAEHLCPEA
jgi:phosphotransferase system  glucose/maltose/N-acetylglucosamine-specific IIC component